MDIQNLSRPGEPPQNGDKIRKNFSKGRYEESFYYEEPPLSGRKWRDMELTKTDWIVPVVDHPQHGAYLQYRQALRDWPSTPNFPNNKPEL